MTSETRSALPFPPPAPPSATTDPSPPTYPSPLSAPPALSFTGITYDVPLPTSRLTSLARRLRGAPAPDVEAPDAAHTLRILHSVSACVHQGESLAILGPSGAGKSSLLNILAGRAEQPLRGGAVAFFGAPRDSRTKRKIGYCMQDDVFFTNLSVGETLEFTGDIHNDAVGSGGERKAKVAEIVSKLRLGKCMDTQIGNSQFSKGISGGERKRLNIANELLATPEGGILLCDEPVSGLDSAGALTVVRLLRQLADDGRAIVSTIHQPTSLMWSLFDSVLLLSEGRCCYFGPAKDAPEYFANIGFPIPPHYNPADFTMQLLIEDDVYSPSPAKRALGSDATGVASDDGGVTSSSQSSSVEPKPHDAGPELARHYLMRMWRERGTQFLRSKRPELLAAIGGSVEAAFEDGDGVRGRVGRQRLVGKAGTVARGGARALSKRSANLLGRPDPSGLEQKYATSWLRQVSVLGKRCIRQKRGALLDKIQLCQLTAVIAICALFWFRMDKNESTIEDRIGSVFFYTVFFSFFATFSALFAFPAEKAVLNKDRSSGAYRLSAYYCAKTLVELPADTLYPLIFGCVVYWMTGLNTGFDRFIIFNIIMVCLTLTSQSLGLLLSAAVMDVRRAQVGATITILSCMLISGFYVPRENVPVFLRPFQALSYIKFAYNALVRNEVRGELYPCVPAGTPSTVYSDNGTRCPITGQDVLVGAQLDDTPSIIVNTGILVLFIFILRVLGYLSLKYLHRPHKERFYKEN